MPARDFVGPAARTFDLFERYTVPSAFQPVVDGDFFPADPLDLIMEEEDGGSSFPVRVPLLFGSVEDEGLFLRGVLNRDPGLADRVERDWEAVLAIFALGRWVGGWGLMLAQS